MATATTTLNGTLNKYSSTLTQKRSQVGSQAMLYGVGLTDEDMHKPVSYTHLTLPTTPYV